MAFNMYRGERLPRTYTITATDEAGEPVTLTSIDFAIVAPRSGPDSAVWTSNPVAAGKSTVVLAVAPADTASALAVPVTSGDLYRRWVDGGYIDIEFVERISVS